MIKNIDEERCEINYLGKLEEIKLQLELLSKEFAIYDVFKEEISNLENLKNETYFGNNRFRFYYRKNSINCSINMPFIVRPELFPLFKKMSTEADKKFLGNPKDLSSIVVSFKN